MSLKGPPDCGENGIPLSGSEKGKAQRREKKENGGERRQGDETRTPAEGCDGPVEKELPAKPVMVLPAGRNLSFHLVERDVSGLGDDVGAFRAGYVVDEKLDQPLRFAFGVHVQLPRDLVDAGSTQIGRASCRERV